MYAQDTSVSVEKSRAEIETILAKYGASRFCYMTGPTAALIGFVAHGKAVRFSLPLPDKADFATKMRYKSRVDVSPEEMHRNWEQACRSRWRALALCIKAKLEAVCCGITSFEQEFLAHFVVPGGQTIGERVIPQLEDMVTKGRAPALSLMDGR